MSTAEKLKAALAANPKLTIREAAEMLSVSRQRIHQIVKSSGIDIRRGRQTEAAPLAPRKPLASLFERMSPYQAACVAESIVGADLCLRGYDVYSSAMSCGLCDFVVVVRETGKCIRIEVKTARRLPSGAVIYSPTAKNRFDVLALVFSDRTIEYRPALPQ